MRTLFNKWIGVCCSLVFLTLFTSNIASAQYCASASTNSGFEFLTNVTFGGVNNTTTGSGYSDYTTLIGNVSAGIPFSFTASHTQTFSGDNEQLQVWVDWNQDDLFSTDERTQFPVCTDACTRTQMISVPAGALIGNTRMRVILSWNVIAAGPCITGFDGETEDYTVNVQTGDCTPPNFTFTVINDCEANNYDISALLTDFGTNTFVTVNLTRSDGIIVSPIPLLSALQNQTVNILNNVPFGVTVSAVIASQNPICNLTRNFAQLICPVVNDECADALPLPCNSSYYGTNQGANADTVGCAPFGNSGPGVWFSYTPTAQTIVTLSTCDALTTFDTDLTIFTGSCSDLTCFTGFSDDGYTDGSAAGCSLPGLTFSGGGTFTALAGETYYILLSGYFTDDIGEYNLTVTCQELTCTSPNLALSVVDVNGNPVVGCLGAGAPYYINATLSGGTGNTNYNVILNGGTSVSIAAGGSSILGPISTGTAANVVATGASEALCSASASVASPPVCAALNDLPCNAISIPTDGTLVSGTNIGATADIDEVAPPQGVCNGTMSWCDGPVVNNSIWFTFVGPASGRVRIDGCNPGSSFDSQFAIYTADDCNNYETFELIGANDDRPAPLFAACNYGSFRSGIELCVEEGVTYYLQVDGYAGATGITGVTINEIDAAACNCVPPVVPPGFTFASTSAYCGVGTVGYTVTFYSPEDIGSSDFFVYTYNIDGGNSGVLNIAAGDSITLEDIIPLGTLINITITLSDEACGGGVAPDFPLSGSIAQDTAACDPDCEGVDGGTALPGTTCDDGNPLTVGDSYNADCECTGNLPAENDEPCDATILACGVPVIQTTQGATQTLAPITCDGFTAAQAIDVWFTFTADGVSSYTVTETEFSDLVLEAFSSDGCGDLTSIECVDLTETFNFGVLAAGDYYIRAYAYSNFAPPYDINIQLDCINNNAVILNGTVNWNSNCGDRTGSVKIYTPNTSTLIGTYNITVASNGTFSILDLPAGTYDVIVKIQGYLAKGVQDVLIETGNNTLAVGAIRNGNINNDNSINLFDVSLLNAGFNKSVGQTGYNPLADLNCDGNINIFDISILNASFNKTGAIAPLN